MERVPWARDLAGRLLAGPLPVRWAHTQGVGRKAESIAHVAGEDAELFMSAAWLHDIGYAPDLVKTGLHALDGARYLRDVEKASDRLCRLVANHSSAIFEARRRNLADELTVEFPDVAGFLKDALTYCDMTTSPAGFPIEVEARLSEILDRYPHGDIVADSIREARWHIIQAARKVSHVTTGANPTRYTGSTDYGGHQ